MSKAGGTDGQPGNPFKVISVGLLIVVVVMALVFTTREMDREVTDQDRMAAAESEVGAVGLFLEEGDLPNAIIALHDIGLRLGRVEGAEDAARAVTMAVAERSAAFAAAQDELRGARKEIELLKELLAEARRLRDFGTERNRALVAVRDMNALILRNAAEGRSDLSRRLLDAAEEKDVVGIAVESLVARIEALSGAAAASGAERVHRLRTLARTWPVAGVEAFAALAGDQEDRRLRARAAIAAAETALGRKDPRGVRDSLVAALNAAGVPEVSGLIGRMLENALRVGAARAEEEGRPAEAAAAWRVVGETAKAEEIEAGILRDALGEALAMHAGALAAGKDWFGAAGAFEIAYRVTAEKRHAKETELCRARGWLHLADEFHKRGLMYAAAQAAVEGTAHDSKLSEPVADRILAEIKDHERLSTLGDADRALTDGNPVRAAEILKDVDAPPELVERIEEAKREHAVDRARVALHAGDGRRALELLESVGEDGPLAAEARLLAGDVAKGVAGLAGTGEQKALVLLSTGWRVLDSDPARAARLGLASVELTEIRPGAVALLKAALAKAGDPAKGDELWDTVRATLFAAELVGAGVR